VIIVKHNQLSAVSVLNQSNNMSKEKGEVKP